MAGSLRNFQYTTDLGDVFLYRADESNTEAVNGTAANIVAGNLQNMGIPRNIIPRKVFYRGDDGNRTISVIAATVAIYNAPPTTIDDPIDGEESLTLVRKTPERMRMYPNVDTGLTDGDAPL